MNIPGQTIYNTRSRCVVRVFPYKDRTSLLKDGAKAQTSANIPAITKTATGEDVNSKRSQFLLEDIIPGVNSGSSAGIPLPIQSNQNLVQKNRKLNDQSIGTDKAMDTGEFIEDDAIIGCSIFREKASASASFQLTLIPKKNYYNMIRPGDWIMIYLDNEDKIDLQKNTGLKIVGVVNRVAVNKVTNNDGTISTTYLVHGQDFGKIFEVTEFFYNPYLNQEILSAFIYPLLNFQLQGTPKDFVQKYLEEFLGNGKLQGLENVIYPMLLPGSVYNALNGEGATKQFAVSFYDILQRDFKDDTSEGFALFKDLTRINGNNLWAILQQSANTIVNELFTDIRDGKPTLIFRKQPLTVDMAKKMMDTSLKEISSSAIVNINMGLSEQELFNYISIWSSDDIIKNASYFAAAAFSEEMPALNKDSTKRYGLRRIDRSTDYGFSFDQNSYNFDILLKWLRELKEFWFNCYHFESGTIDLLNTGVDELNFKIGEFIKIAETGRCYLVESTAYEWTLGNPIEIQLTVTYGINQDGSYIDQTRDENIDYGTGYMSRVSDKDFSNES